MIVTGLHIYPLKSGRMRDLQRCRLDHRGLEGDRRWLVVDAKGRFLTARQHPPLVLIRLADREGSVLLQGPDREPLDVALPDSPAIPVSIWRSNTTARDAGEEAARWVSDYLGVDARLFYQADEDIRRIEDWPGVRETDRVSFADGYPLLLIGSASLDELNTRLARPVDMDRFRPNLVVRTEGAFEEDAWRHLRVGECEFDVIKRCARCVLTTVDPKTGECGADGEPLKTLRSFRFDRQARGVLFGVNLIPRRLGTVSVGDPVLVLD